MNKNRFTVDECSDKNLVLKVLKQQLLYRRIKEIKVLNNQTAFITLDNNITLEFHGNQGCACGNGMFYITKLIKEKPDAAITDVEFSTDYDSSTENYKFNISIFYENKQENLICYEGFDNGYYGTGFEIEVSCDKNKLNQMEG